MDPARDPKTFVTRFELDYFRRRRVFRRWKWLLSLVALLISTTVLAALVAVPRFHTAFQSGPVSHSHAVFGNNCAACHDQPFGTAIARFIPGSKVGTVSDAKCLACHDAGRHSPYQLHNTGPDGKATGCIECHKEHRGDNLSRLTDIACTNCHSNLQATSGTGHMAAHIHHFADGHPEFGVWRKTELHDPAGGKLSFNHKRHLELANELNDLSKGSRPLLAKEAERLREQDCAYCHKLDGDMKRMQPIRYDQHCVACHPLNVKAMPADQWPADVAAEIGRERLPHPGPNEDASNIRAAIRQLYTRFSSQAKPAAPGTVMDPSILRSDADAKKIQEQERINEARTRLTETQLFGAAKSGCQLCHTETARNDGVPAYADPHQPPKRWKDDINQWPVERLRHSVYADAANRWHPLAKFDHGVHRTYACTECHDVRNSTQTADVLIPTIDRCKTCHNQSASSARSGCLTCHNYHDRSQERPVLRETPEAMKATMQRATP